MSGNQNFDKLAPDIGSQKDIKMGKVKAYSEIAIKEFSNKRYSTAQMTGSRGPHRPAI